MGDFFFGDVPGGKTELLGVYSWLEVVLGGGMMSR
jgi:hypothetical protein